MCAPAKSVCISTQIRTTYGIVLFVFGPVSHSNSAKDYPDGIMLLQLLHPRRRPITCRRCPYLQECQKNKFKNKRGNTVPIRLPSVAIVDYGFIETQGPTLYVNISRLVACCIIPQYAPLKYCSRAVIFHKPLQCPANWTESPPCFWFRCQCMSRCTNSSPQAKLAFKRTESTSKT